MAAVRTGVVAEVPDVRGRVTIWGAAPQAVLRIGRVLQLVSRMTRIVDPERQRTRAVAAQVAHLRVVAVHHQLRVGQRRDGFAPACSDQLQLAVPVELVAKEVAEQQCLRP